MLLLLQLQLCDVGSWLSAAGFGGQAVACQTTAVQLLVSKLLVWCGVGAQPMSGVMPCHFVLDTSAAVQFMHQSGSKLEGWGC